MSKQRMNNSTIPWVEKYRPAHFDTIVLDPINRTLFENIISKKYFPNLLFYGPPGTGKTTTIINLINEFQSKHFKINKSLVIHLNASDERGIDIIRNQIHSFVKSKNMFEIGFKFVILDEVDYMTKNAQHALKSLLQTCSGDIKFCLICNYISKIEEPLKNEFTCIRFNQLPKNDIYKFIKTILVNENLSINERAIDMIQHLYQSDIRSMINFIQLNQNLTVDEWDCKIINIEVLANIRKLLHSTSENTDDIIKTIYEASVQFNTDKRSILQAYLNYVIRNCPTDVTSEYVDVMCEILHNTDVGAGDLVNYFCYQLNGLSNKPPFAS
jgi:replication factor C subunit 3/5